MPDQQSGETMAPQPPCRAAATWRDGDLPINGGVSTHLWTFERLSPRLTSGHWFSCWTAASRRLSQLPGLQELISSYPSQLMRVGAIEELAKQTALI
jgi:hypothetical protein